MITLRGRRGLGCAAGVELEEPRLRQRRERLISFVRINTGTGNSNSNPGSVHVGVNGNVVNVDVGVAITWLWGIIHPLSLVLLWTIIHHPRWLKSLSAEPNSRLGCVGPSFS